jgi:hypothetical protein
MSIDAQQTMVIDRPRPEVAASSGAWPDISIGASTTCSRSSTSAPTHGSL